MIQCSVKIKQCDATFTHFDYKLKNCDNKTEHCDINHNLILGWHNGT